MSCMFYTNLYFFLVHFYSIKTIYYSIHFNYTSVKIKYLYSNIFCSIGEAKVKDGAAGVHLTMAREGRPSGEAYVEMESEDDLKAALKKDREHMGNRYIEGEFNQNTF